MSYINYKYNQLCNIPSDINEHLPILYQYGCKCKHITEAGVRSVISSYAFASALKGKEYNRLIQIDTAYNSNIDNFNKQCKNEGINAIFYHSSDLDCPLEQTELLFIDTWHVYGQLKRELDRWHNYVTKYIILHDTTVDEWVGESIREGHNINEESVRYNMTIEEIEKGLWYAIEEFLNINNGWIIEKRYINNNGLTILKRIDNIHDK